MCFMTRYSKRHHCTKLIDIYSMMGTESSIMCMIISVYAISKFKTMFNKDKKKKDGYTYTSCKILIDQPIRIYQSFIVILYVLMLLLNIRPKFATFSKLNSPRYILQNTCV
ncbi:hypothetical protein BDA99DRAFT_531144 [Phascolomyces articulosus]|uniref:Uncharacterized protein n=1 Tax=Phascolomyces articulosus TaxID=60185 RepID=A0AAD5PJ70_9FUNG|nr:hypothetical protein BDA99DRAFT_531144 [Phascolomyces articulosus]